MSDRIFERMIISFTVLLLAVLVIAGVSDNSREIEMAKAGLQQCLVDRQVLWQKECGK